MIILHAVVASLWQRVRDLIGSGFESLPPVPEADILPPEPSRYFCWFEKDWSICTFAESVVCLINLYFIGCF